MATKYTCPSCGSDEILIDAYVYANDPEDGRTAHLYDNWACSNCGYDGNSFNETEVPDETPPKTDAAIAHNYLVVIGRMHGDDEDTIRLYGDSTREQAMELFIEDMCEENHMTKEEHEAEASKGRGVYINHVLASQSPIADI